MILNELKWDKSHFSFLTIF